MARGLRVNTWVAADGPLFGLVETDLKAIPVLHIDMDI